MGAGAAKGLKKRKEKFIAKVQRRSEEMFSGEGKKKPQRVDENKLEGAWQTITDPGGAGKQFGTEYGKSFGKEMVKAGGKVAAIGAGAYLGSKIIGKAIDGGKKKKTKKIKEGFSTHKIPYFGGKPGDGYIGHPRLNIPSGKTIEKNVAKKVQ